MKTLLRVASDTKAHLWAATGQRQKGLNVCESQRLEALAGNRGL